MHREGSCWTRYRSVVNARCIPVRVWCSEIASTLTVPNRFWTTTCPSPTRSRSKLSAVKIRWRGSTSARARLWTELPSYLPARSITIIASTSFSERKTPSEHSWTCRWRWRWARIEWTCKMVPIVSLRILAEREVLQLRCKSNSDIQLFA